jgi:signal transduction histidine kinase
LIREQLRILTSLVNDLFEVALIDAGAVTLELRDGSLDDLIASSLGTVRAEAETRNIRLEARTRQADVPVRMAPEKVERVLLNLLANAVRHTPDGGTVSVVVEPADDRLLVAVEDTGKGLTRLAGRRMFDLFWRDDESRTRSTGGAGIGLAVAQGLVRAHGGTIWAENRGAGGARVAFTLPLAHGRRLGRRAEPATAQSSIEREQQELRELARREVVVADEHERAAAVRQPRAERHALDVVERDA